MNQTFLFLLPFLVVFLPFGLKYLYVFQIKEYRFDRLFSQMREDGLVTFVINHIGRRPAVTTRNILIGGISTVLFLVTNFLILLSVSQWIFHSDATCYGSLCMANHTIQTVGSPQELFTILVLFIASPLTAFVTTSIGVMLTEPLAQQKRNAIIARAAAMAARSNTIFIGISGTYGKTTTKEYLFHILSQKYRVAKTDENMNTDVGVAMSILKNLKKDTEYFVAEVGAYKLGEVTRAASIFKPHHVIMMPFGNQHLDLYGSKDNLVTAESEILGVMRPNGIVYANADIPELEYIKTQTTGRLLTYSIQQKADVMAHTIETSEKGSSANVTYDHLAFGIETKLLGKHVIQNLLPAIAIAIHAGMTQDAIAQAIASLDHIPGKLSVHTGHNGAVILNDSSNSSVNGFVAALDTMRLFNKPKKYILSKGIIELGKAKKESYEKIIVQIDKDQLQLYTTDHLFKKLSKSKNITIMRTEEQILSSIVSQIDDQSVVLLEGKFTKSFVKKLL